MIGQSEVAHDESPLSPKRHGTGERAPARAHGVAVVAGFDEPAAARVGERNKPRGENSSHSRDLFDCGLEIAALAAETLYSSALASIQPLEVWKVTMTH
jgi:hypothetical protein